MRRGGPGWEAAPPTPQPRIGGAQTISPLSGASLRPRPGHVFSHKHRVWGGRWDPPCPFPGSRGPGLSHTPSPCLSFPPPSAAMDTEGQVMGRGGDRVNSTDPEEEGEGAPPPSPLPGSACAPPAWDPRHEGAAPVALLCTESPPPRSLQPNPPTGDGGGQPDPAQGRGGNPLPALTALSPLSL